MQNGSIISDEQDIVAVTVTYSRRWNFLHQSIASALGEGIRYALVVSNAAKDTIAEEAAKEFGAAVKVVDLPANTGSANGFKVGIEAAVAQGAEYILLLDDDNVLVPGALAALAAAHADLARSISRDRLAVLGFRPDHQPDIAAGLPLARVVPHPDSFFGFHLADIPFKFWRRTCLARRHYAGHLLPERVKLDVAPYSGMFFHRSVVENIGTPDPDLVLYGDDTEFSYRLTKAGGGIWLIPAARLSDLEASWNIKDRFRSSFEGWLCGGEDLRAYYGARNGAYFERHCRPHNSLVRAINRQIYLLGLRFFACRLSKMGRYQLLRSAIADGENRKLGVNTRFHL